MTETSAPQPTQPLSDAQVLAEAAAELRFVPDEASNTSEQPQPSLMDVAAQLAGDEPEAKAEPTPPAPVEEPAKPEPSAEERKVKSYERYLETVAKATHKRNQELAKLKEERTQQHQLIEQGKRFQELMRLKDQDPLAFLDHLRISTDVVAKKMLAEAEAEHALTPQDIEARVLAKAQQQLEQRLAAEREQARLEAEARHNDIYIREAITQYQQKIAETLQANESKYELINLFGQHGRVWREVVNVFQQTRQVPDLEIVCDAIEESLQQDADKYTKSKRYAERSAAKPSANNSNGTSNKPVTLTNNSAKASAEIITDDLTDEQALQLAIKELRFVEE